jgi:hypothetical protein
MVMWDSWEPYNEFNADHNFNDGEYWPLSEDTISEDNEEIDDHVVTLSEVQLQNIFHDISYKFEKAIETNDLKVLEEVKSNIVFAGSMVVRKYHEKHIPEDIMFRFGEKVEKLKKICNTAINRMKAENVNF